VDTPLDWPAPGEFRDYIAWLNHQDLVRAEADYTLPDGGIRDFVEDLRLQQGFGPLRGFGNGLDNSLQGNTAGNVLNGAIYARNLWIDGRAETRRLGRVPAALLGLIAIFALAVGGVQTLRTNESTTVAWIACAMFGQVLWSSRFVLQWWYTEKSGKSHFPRAFWWVSLAGNLALLSYAIHLADIVYIAGFVPGPIVQLRNLALGNGRGATGRVVAAD